MRSVPRLIAAAVALGMTIAGAAAGEHAYTGNKKCKMCHIKEWNSWSTTKMALAFDLLKPGVRPDQKKAAGLDPAKDYTRDPQCLPCHTVGFGKPGGFVDIAATPDHAGVGCEMCHGPGGTYTQKEYMSLQNPAFKRDPLVAVGLVAPIVAGSCTETCHNSKSPFAKKPETFDFAARRDQGTHEHFPLKNPH
jgi:hypothetical protein